MSMINAFQISTTATDAALMAEARRTSLLWKKPVNASAKIELFDFTIDNTTLDAAAESIVHSAALGQRQRIAFLNAHVINTASKDASYARVLDGADRLFADGSGMALAAKLCGRPLVDNVNGTDLLPLLCAAAQRANQKIFFLGGKPGVALETAVTLGRLGFADVIAGTHHGYVQRGGKEENDAIAAVNASGASILLIGMGVPIQDIWISRNREKISSAIILGVGGLFDFFAGSVSRAPAGLRSIGMEWVWRLAQEPRRMWQRYLVGNVTFMARAAKYAVQTRIDSASHDSGLARKMNLLRAAFRARVVSAVRPALKRAFDVTVAAGALTILSVPLLIVIGLIKLDSRGPVMYKQTRIGRNGRPFTMFKFRSMHVNADQLHAKLSGNSTDPHLLRFKAKQDPRVTRMGRFIRKASIDELPQIWNVLHSDMSIVGPRPALPSEVARYTLGDRDRLLVKPGITCTWQVNGRADIDFVGQVELDREYVKSFSILKDISLIIRTIPAVLTARGAY